MHTLQDRPIKDHVNPTVFHGHTLQADDESKEVDSISAECIFIQLAIQLEVMEPL